MLLIAFELAGTTSRYAHLDKTEGHPLDKTEG